MRLLLERFVNINGEFQETFSEVGSPVRGVSFHISEWGSDPIVLTTGETGSEGVAFNGGLVVSGSDEASFGGPVAGPLVTVTWNGTVDLKRGVIRLWDEPLPAFGAVNLGRFHEAAVGAGGFAADWGFNAWGSWVRRVTVFWTGDQPFALTGKFNVGNVTAASYTALDTNAAGEIRMFDLASGCQSADFRLQNTGAGAGEVWATLRAQLG